jgi:hypothetical protein
VGLGPTTAATLALTGSGLGLGAPLTLADATARFGARVLVPKALGSPDAVYVSSGQVWLVYASGDELPSAPEVAGIGLLVSEFRATVDPQVLLGKSIPPGTRVDEVQVGVNHGFWIEGAPHVFLRYANGSFADAAPRLAGNTLLWEQGGLTLRIESALQRDAALRIAESVGGTD